ncbi:UNVERIFIED_CONTAM: Peptidyl-prolyl cis-trans isomerase CYP57 [Sesamum radiatum]|uniref:Peptidyl-prolyl cis-trans isomerase CYP57 n=1 Tax=Sesamum radiatum TaxID=300843 RepID=A0AAW2MIH2_SESRA
MANADADLQLLGEAERERQLQKQKKRRRQGHEDEKSSSLWKECESLVMIRCNVTAGVMQHVRYYWSELLDLLSAFSTKSEGSNGEHGGRKDDDLSDWMGVTLKFAPEPGKNHMSRSDDPNDYVVHDPLLEKGKEKFNKMQAKEKRRQREWAGKSLT